MSFFAYSAVDSSGQIVKGAIEAEDLEAATRDIVTKGLYLVSISRSSNFIAVFMKSFQSFSVSRAEIIEFAQNLSVMLRAGMPILTCLEDIAAATENKVLKSAIFDIKQQVERGSSVSAALEAHGSLFPDILKRLAAVGEQTGRFDASLSDAAEHMLRMQNLASAIKRALMYPAFAITTTMGALVFWLAFVLPKMVGTMKGMGVKLPPLTLFLIGASNLFQQHWKLLLLIPVIVPLAFYLSGKHPRIRYLRDLAFIKTPILKLIMYNKLVAVFAELFRILIVAGMTIDRVFDLTIPALGNEYFRVKLLKAKENILNGSMISESLKEQDILPLLVIRMINIGEASGTLDNQLEFLAKHYTKKLDDATDSMGKIIEPVVMVVIGGMFAVIIMGLLLPIYDLVSNVGKS
jgi:type II secretory pathway component PulF